MKIWKKISLSLLFILFWGVVSSHDKDVSFPGSLEYTSKTTKIAVFYSRNPRHERLREFTSGISAYISNRKINSLVHNLSIDPTGERDFDDKSERIKIIAKNTINRKYADVIIATDRESHRLISTIDSSLYANMPVVSICTKTNHIEPLPQNLICEIDWNFEKNFLLGMKLFPRTKRVIFISDDSDYGLAERNLAQNTLSKYKNKVRITYISPPSEHFDLFINEITKQPDRTFIILSSWLLDNVGNYNIKGSYYPFLSRLGNIPVFGNQNLSLGSGILGGYLTSMWDVGNIVAEKAIKMARGMLVPSTISINCGKLILDYNVIKRLNVPEERIPRETSYINKPFNIFDDYSTEINFIIFIIVILSVSLISLAYYHFRFLRVNKDNLKLSKENEIRKELLDKTLSVMTEGVITFDPGLKIININKTGVEMSGYSGEFIGLTFNEVFHTSRPHNEISVSDALIKCIKEKGRVQIPNSTKINYPDKESRIISGNVSPVIDSDGQISQIVFAFYDRTESFTQQRFLKLAAETAKSYTWAFNTLTKNIYLDENYFKHIKGEAPEESLIRFFLSKIHPDDRKALVKPHNIMSSETTGEMYKIEFRMSVDNGATYEWWERRGIVYLEREGRKNVRYIYGMDINIDDHKRREKELIEARLRAEESDKLKTAFLSNMSHEIRTPLNGLVGFANLLTEPDYSADEKRRFVEVINESSRKLMSLISDILDLSRIESNALLFEVKPFDLSDNINDVIYSFKNQEKSNVRIVAELPEKPLTLSFDAFRNRQILNNLISNSLKFTDVGEIRVGYKVYEKFVEVFVSDTGIGIEKKNLSAIFERFFKINEFVGGTGLGLPLCKAIVEKFGGRIWAESEFGAGTTIRYTINFPDIPESDKTGEIPETEQKTEKPELMTDNDLQPLILIAEDLDSNYQLLRIMLSKFYRLIWAKNGEEAVEMYKINNPAVILMDIKMPVMDGLEATKIIRKYSKDVIIIAQTANAFESDHKIAIEAGCNDVVTKPIRSTVLLAAIKKHLSQ